MKPTTLSPYEINLNKNWNLMEDKDCKNYLQARTFCEANGYHIRSDVSYNGFITLSKEICLSEENQFDGHRIDLQIYSDVKKKDKYHNFQVYNVEADFGSIFSEIKYRFKSDHTLGTGHNSTTDLQELFSWVLEREKILIKENEELNKNMIEQ